ncbi:uncharacterized protein LOC124846972 [Vigna umbellata]|uniref:uncharacterized protein LOC124846972 n=1 Tax=Vigna umbellata TaxID=87088 RepID=UPI001F5FBADE|nr:uncharacterized protein LOC124846972 [Vigna umbellata]
MHGCYCIPKFINIGHSCTSWCIFSFLQFVSLYFVTYLLIPIIRLGDSGTFEYEKKKNIELVDYMKAKEKNLIAMAREVEMLRAEILNAEKRVHAPDLFRASTPGQSSGPFVDAYGRTHSQMASGQGAEGVVPIGDSNGVAAVNSSGVSGGLWSSPYDPSVGRR